jgi:hypothetical protein
MGFISWRGTTKAALMIMALLYPYSAFSPHFVQDAAVVLSPGGNLPGTVILNFPMKQDILVGRREARS